MQRSIVVLSGLASLAFGCATLADAAKGDENLPNAGVGPFRALRKGELGLSLVAPNAVDDDKSLARDASVIDADGDPATFEVVGYFAASTGGAGIEDPPSLIRRGVARDGRSFERMTSVVLEVTEDWEKGSIGAPAALLHEGETWLYYSSWGGIGLAKSADGVTFTKGSGPVLAEATSGWDAGALPQSPSVIALPEGGFAMFYEVLHPTSGPAIGEARSDDGVTWTRVNDGPALSPAAPSEDAYDDDGVGAPCAMLGETALGRPVLWLYYEARSGDARTIGLAGRFGDGAFDRAASPVFGAGTSRAPRQPSAVAFDGFVLLFATQHKSTSSDSPAVAAGVAPAQAALPAIATE